jgi:hypothetical protein
MYSIMGNGPLSGDVAFTALALFNLLGHPFAVLPKTVSIVAEVRPLPTSPRAVRTCGGWQRRDFFCYTPTHHRHAPPRPPGLKI